MNEEIEENRIKIEELENRVEELEKKVEDGVELDKELSISEFINTECQLSSNKERVLVVGFYLEAYEDHNTFSKVDIEDGFERCGLSNPANTSARVSDAISEGWIEVKKSDQPREWSLTKTGVRKVEEFRSGENGE